MNEIFRQYHNIHQHETCFLFGTGPSLSKFNTSDVKEYTEDSILIGVNEIIHYDIPMDYFFIGDAGNKTKGFNCRPTDYIEYKPNIAKFFRSNRQIAQHIPQLPQHVEGVDYYTTTGWTFRHPLYRNEPMDFNKDITTGLADSGTIILEALQFALYTGVSTIYLVGCDCDYSSGTFNTSSHIDHSLKAFMLQGWVKIKKFIDNVYPDIDVISINPVGLSEIFDKY